MNAITPAELIFIARMINLKDKDSNNSKEFKALKPQNKMQCLRPLTHIVHI